MKLDFQTDAVRTDAIFAGATDDLARIIANIEECLRTDLDRERSLLLFDEVQLNEKALDSLRFFSESGWRAIATGSLLGVSARKRGLPLPSGVRQVELHPMDFEEWLWAAGERRMADDIREHARTLEPYILHDEALDLYYRYLVVGGMPRAVLTWTQDHDHARVREVLDEIDLTCDACFPLSPYNDEEGSYFKAYIVDTGLMLRKFRVDAETYLDPALQDVLSSDFRGALAENAVMQALVANDVDTYYWMPKPTVGSGEVDFVYQTGRAEVVPVEVKSGRNVRAKSLRRLVEEGRSPRAYRLSEQNFSKSIVEGTECVLAGLPLYASFTLGT